MKNVIHFNRFMVTLVAMLTMSLTSAWGVVTTLTQSAIYGDGSTSSYGKLAITDSAKYVWNAYAIRDQHSKATSNYHFLQIKKYSSSTAYYIQVPTMPGKITQLKMTVSGSSKPMDGGSNTATLYFSASNSTYQTGDGVVSGTGASSITIDASGLKLNTGYITASGAIRIWDVEVTYEQSSEPLVSLSPSVINFGTIHQNATVDAKTVSALLSNVSSATASISGSMFTISPTSLTTNGNITITPVSTATVGDYEEDLILSADGAKSDTVIVKMKVAIPIPYVLVNDVEALSEGTEIIIVNSGDTKAMGAQNENNRAAVSIKESNDTILVADGDGVQVITLGKSDDFWTLGVGNSQYLYAAGGNSSNSLKSTTTIDAKAKWAISFGADTVDVVAQDEATLRDTLQYNNSGIFSCYRAGSQNPIKIYRKEDLHVLTVATCTNGSVEASVAGTPIASGEKINSGLIVTLSNAPAEGYELDAYKVYKTDDVETVVEVTDGTFKMPSYPVTVSATFKLLPSLESISVIQTPKTEYIRQEALDTTGLRVQATYDIVPASIITPVIKQAPDMDVVGDAQRVVLSYTYRGVEKMTYYEINIKSIANTLETAYTVEQAKALADKGKDLASFVYVKGIVSKVDNFNSDNGTITYWLDNAMQLADGKDAAGANFTAMTDVQVGDTVIAKGLLAEPGDPKLYVLNNSTREQSIRPNVLQSIVLSGDTIKNFAVGDAFSHNGMVVTAKYNVNDDADVTLLATWSSPDMTTDGTKTVTVSYEEGGVKAQATYKIYVVNPGCQNLILVSKGVEENGTYDLSNSGEVCADDAVSITVAAQPSAHYHVESVTSLKGETTIGTIGEIVNDTCIISGINDTTTITVIFAENAKDTATFVKGAEEAEGEAPADIVWYVGENITLPANTFTYSNYKFIGWSDGNDTFQPGDQYTMPADGVTFTAQWEKLSIWATTYTSNLPAITANYMVNIEDGGYNANKVAAGGQTTVTLGAGADTLHFHAVAWKGEADTIRVTIDDISIDTSFAIVADSEVDGEAHTYNLSVDPARECYFFIPVSGLSASATVTFAAAEGKRFVLFGVNQQGGSVPTSLYSLDAECATREVQKMLLNGRLLILRDGKLYSPQGQLVR